MGDAKKVNEDGPPEASPSARDDEKGSTTKDDGGSNGEFVVREETNPLPLVRADSLDSSYLDGNVVENDELTSRSSHHRRCLSVDHFGKAPPVGAANGTSKSFKVVSDKVQIDTAAPFESVKAAVSKFGGIVDWKAHRVHTVERRKFIEQELEKAQEELPSYKQQCEAAQDSKLQVLKQLESTKRLIEELKLNLERAQTEEQQAKQDSELAKLRVEEMEQGIADDASFAAKAQLEVAKARHAAAVSELKTIKDELQQLKTDYAMLIAEKDAAETKAEEALSASKHVEKSVESLTIELITLKQSLDSEHSAHLEAEEHRIGAVMAREHDSLNWEMELKQAEEELDKLKQQMISAKELKSKLLDATTLLHDLKVELAAYMESELPDSDKQGDLFENKQTRGDIEAAINSTKTELVDVKLKIEKAIDEVNILKVASTSLKSELEKENLRLEAIQQREGMASVAVASLEIELDRIKSEIALLHEKEKEEREKMAHLPNQLEEAVQKADEAKALARKAQDELQKVKDEVKEAKTEASNAESKLRSVQKEIEAAKAGEKLALAAINAMGERSEELEKDDSTNGITLSLEEYYELSKRAHEAEEQAKLRVEMAMSEIEIAKESEMRSLNKIEEVGREMSQRKEAHEIALQKAEVATQGKLSVENELRKWRAEHEQRRKAPLPTVNTGSEDLSPSSSTLHQRSSPRFHTATTPGEPTSNRTTKKKKKSFFPRFFMFLGRRKTHASSKTD